MNSFSVEKVSISRFKKLLEYVPTVQISRGVMNRASVLGLEDSCASLNAEMCVIAVLPVLFRDSKRMAVCHVPSITPLDDMLQSIDCVDATVPDPIIGTVLYNTEYHGPNKMLRMFSHSSLNLVATQLDWFTRQMHIHHTRTRLHAIVQGDGRICYARGEL